jgi:hypothetical protein
VAGLQQQIESLFSFQDWTRCTSLILRSKMIFMRVHKHWLDYDVAAVAFLIVGIAAVGLLALII